MFETETIEQKENIAKIQKAPGQDQQGAIRKPPWRLSVVFSENRFPLFGIML